MSLFLRIANQLRCYASYALSLCGVVHVRHLPTFVSVEPANVCQLRCPECPVGMRHGRPIGRGELLSRELYDKILSQAAPRAHTIQFYFQGEPLLNPHLPEMIRAANDAGLYTIVSTNAQALDRETAKRLVDSGLRRIIISMDGLSQEAYEAYRQGGDVEKAKAAIHYLHEEREKAGKRGRRCGRPRIELQCLLLRSNEAEWRDLKEQYIVLGADCLTFKTAQLYDYAHGHPLMPTDVRYARYERGKDGVYRLKRSGLRRMWEKWFGVSPCYRLWAGCVVTASGEVLPCCYDKEHAHTYGNLHDSSLRALFGSDNANCFRRQVIRAGVGHVHEICANCWH